MKDLEGTPQLKPIVVGFVITSNLSIYMKNALEFSHSQYVSPTLSPRTKLAVPGTEKEL